MKVAIQDTKGSFSDRWIDYCRSNNIDYKLVDCYSSDIIKQFEDCDVIMWHFNHKGPRDSKFARQLLYSVEVAGKVVFPDFRTSWHFDDKVAQKYLLEALGAPLVKSYVFYDKQQALEWANNTDFPKVFKLRTGAGSDNVRLCKTRQDAISLIKRSFGRGFNQYNAWANLKERIRKYRHGKTNLFDVLKALVRLVYTTEYSRVSGKEIGYVYFQDFIPENKFDIRVVVIGNRAFAIKRMVRANDFRASGSGTILYEKENFSDATIKIAFEVSEKLQAQCMTYDFVYDNNTPLIVEISYGFAKVGYDDCTGYWDREMNWHNGSFNPYGWMVQLLSDKADM